ncbi:zona pellucida sperm-binding protein 3d.2 [Syngnathoides biaculeatus]|uniref:zona pellucida sperm-binding protein 3d.2 n=1 Tax=Syngnathoides biaculeatus TaxID=300417 RepID=UPI002ADD85CE|nr:zona pellucida sperm-binding protein 3d.2 [Syngnathoides biaculeatus]
MVYWSFLTLWLLFASYQGGKPPLRRAFPPFPRPLTLANRSMANIFPRESSTLPQAYLNLPVFVHSKMPPLEKHHLSPARGSGLEPLPEPVRERLLPAKTGWGLSGPSDEHSVRTLCTMNKMLVRVSKRILGDGEINSQLKLGTCQAKKSSKNYVYFLNHLNECGTKRQMINDQMTYSNTLQYNPGMIQGPIRRSAPFALAVACNYTRYQYSYKIGYLPKMRMRHIFKPMRNRVNFILTPRNAQWQRLAPLDRYVLGEPMFFEAEGPTIPQDMRLYVHSCYATPNKSSTSTPQFTVVKDFGCMIESKYSRSRFIPYKNNVVRFSVDAFLFQGMPEQLYMHCTMSAESDVPTPTAKSCNYDTSVGRWVELHGWDWVCACCDSNCGSSTAALSEITSSRGWKVQPRGQFFKSHKKKRLFSSSKTTTAAASVAKTTTEAIRRSTTPWSDPVLVTDDNAEVKWPFGGGVVEWVEEEEEQRVKGNAVVEEDVPEGHRAFEESEVQATKKSKMKMPRTPTALPPIQKATTETTNPEVMGKVADWEWEEKMKGSAVVVEVKERRRTFEDIFDFGE